MALDLACISQWLEHQIFMDSIPGKGHLLGLKVPFLSGQSVCSRQPVNESLSHGCLSLSPPPLPLSLLLFLKIFWKKIFLDEDQQQQKNMILIIYNIVIYLLNPRTCMVLKSVTYICMKNKFINWSAIIVHSFHSLRIYN